MVRNNWQMFVGEIDKNLCESIIENFKKLPAIEGGNFGGFEDVRKSKVRWVNGEYALRSNILHYVTLSNTVFNVDIHPIISELQFTEYDSEYQGKYDWHHDIDWESNNAYDRKLSVVIQLSDPSEYEGGDFSFLDVENPLDDDLRTQGTIIVFPSYLTHRVSPLLSGKRYSLVSWIWGPRWK